MYDDPIIYLLLGLLLLWHGVALVELARSRRKAGAKLGWMAAVLSLPLLGLAAWALRGRERYGGPARGFGIYISLAGLLVAGLLAVARLWWQGNAYLSWLGAWSLVTLGFYAGDKLAARAGKGGAGKGKGRRVPELVLHALALLGGFAGAWIGRQLIRHKSQKPVFLAVLLGATLAHGCLAAKLAGLW